MGQMMRYQHAIIAHGKAIAEALSADTWFSERTTQQTYGLPERNFSPEELSEALKDQPHEPATC